HERAGVGGLAHDLAHVELMEPVVGVDGGLRCCRRRHRHGDTIMPFSKNDNVLTRKAGRGMAEAAGERWRLRDIPPELAAEYRRAGWWDDRTLGQLAETGLNERAKVAFEAHSKVRPWAGTFGDLDRAARTFAGALQARGVGAGDVVVLQMPNWMEAGIAFFAA